MKLMERSSQRSWLAAAGMCASPRMSFRMVSEYWPWKAMLWIENTVFTRS